VDTRRQDCVLIFRLGSIGDTVVALPCFHGIARAFSQHRRVLLTNELATSRTSSAESILNGTGLVDEVIYYPVGDFSARQTLALMGEIRKLGPATLIYLAERPDALSAYRDLVFFKAAGVPRTIGFPWTRRLRTGEIDLKTQELEYETQRLARTLRRSVTVDLSHSGWDLRLSTAELAKADALLRTAEEPQASIAVAPGAKIADKDWGPDNWAWLLKVLSPRYTNMRLIMVGGPDERALCDRIALNWPGRILNLCGALTPRETAAALRRCKLLICHDSGPMHLAASQQTACVALFGNYNRPRKWYPFGAGHYVIHEPLGVRAISVQRVASTTQQAMDGLHPLS
jgi:heptosyltransferase-3